MSCSLLVYLVNQGMNQTEQLIEVGRAYIDALNKLDREHPECVAHILDILDSAHLEPDYHLGVYIEEPSRKFSCRCQQSWFHCYHKVLPITNNTYKYDKKKYL